MGCRIKMKWLDYMELIMSWLVKLLISQYIEIDWFSHTLVGSKLKVYIYTSSTIIYKAVTNTKMYFIFVVLFFSACGYIRGQVCSPYTVAQPEIDYRFAYFWILLLLSIRYTLWFQSDTFLVYSMRSYGNTIE